MRSSTILFFCCWFIFRSSAFHVSFITRSSLNWTIFDRPQSIWFLVPLLQISFTSFFCVFAILFFFSPRFCFNVRAWNGLCINVFVNTSYYQIQFIIDPYPQTYIYRESDSDSTISSLYVEICKNIVIALALVRRCSLVNLMVVLKATFYSLQFSFCFSPLLFLSCSLSLSRSLSRLMHLSDLVVVVRFKYRAILFRSIAR